MRLLIGLLLISLVLISGCSNDIPINEELAKCIGDNSVLYAKKGCPICEQQEKMFGKHLEYLNTIDCGTEQQKCLEANILKIPTWYFGEKKISSLLTISQIKEITGC